MKYIKWLIKETHVRDWIMDDRTSRQKGHAFVMIVEDDEYKEIKDKLKPYMKIIDKDNYMLVRGEVIGEKEVEIIKESDDLEKYKIIDSILKHGEIPDEAVGV